MCNTTLYLAPEGANSVCIGLENYNITFQLFCVAPLFSTSTTLKLQCLVHLQMPLETGQPPWMSLVWSWHCLFGRDCI